MFQMLQLSSFGVSPNKVPHKDHCVEPKGGESGNFVLKTSKLQLIPRMYLSGYLAMFKNVLIQSEDGQKSPSNLKLQMLGPSCTICNVHMHTYSISLFLDDVRKKPL